MGAVFTRQNTVHRGSFASDTAVMSSNGSVPLGIVQNMQIQFGQQVARIYDLTNGGIAVVPPAGGQAGQLAGAIGGQAAVFYVGGRTNGQVTIARVIGPTQVDMGKFYTTSSDICKPIPLQFEFGAGCHAPQGKQVTPNAPNTVYAITGALLTNVGITVAAQDMIINENCTLMFANLIVTN